jgi:hypothetical protein
MNQDVLDRPRSQSYNDFDPEEDQKEEESWKEKFERMKYKAEELRTIQGQKNAAAQTGKVLAGKLNKIIEEGHALTAFSIATGLAMFKDFIIDPAGDLTTASGIGTAVGIGLFLAEICISAMLFFFLWGKGKWLGRIWIILLGWIPGIGWIPESTFLVVWCWHTIRKRAEKARHKLKNLHKMTEQEIKRLNNDIYSIDQDEMPKPESRAAIHREKIEEQLRLAEEKQARIEALQAKKGYANLNLRTPDQGRRFQRRFNFSTEPMKSTSQNTFR